MNPLLADNMLTGPISLMILGCPIGTEDLIPFSVQHRVMILRPRDPVHRETVVPEVSPQLLWCLQTSTGTATRRATDGVMNCQDTLLPTLTGYAGLPD